MSLSTVDKVQVAFVIKQLMVKEAKQRRLMFNEIAKVFCLYCGESVSICLYKGAPHG